MPGQALVLVQMLSWLTLMIVLHSVTSLVHLEVEDAGPRSCLDLQLLPSGQHSVGAVQ